MQTYTVKGHLGSDCVLKMSLSSHEREFLVQPS